jgi:glycosyltransferase involved in cell wall biosynthesis
MYNFSIIIPHKNIPELLRRCIASIPARDDLQIVIVDDNSDASIVDFNNFPGSGRDNVEIVFSKEKNGRGPGYARNIGLSKAKGKWIIFADADDYFIDSFSALLDKYQLLPKDVIFFKCKRQNENGLVMEYPLINNAIDDALTNGKTDAIVYGVPCPWGKFIKKEFLDKNRILFQEITGGDDILFSIQIGVHLKELLIVEDRLYCVVDRSGSLTRNTHWRSFYSYSKACCDAYEMMLWVAKEKMAVSWLSSWWGFLWAENKIAALSLFPYIFKKMKTIDGIRALKKGVKTGAWNWRAA